MSISVRIQELREKNNLSQEQLAEKINVSRQAISKWETEQANPDINNIVLLSKVFGVSTDYILTGTKSEKPETTNPQKWSYSDIFKTFLVMAGVMVVGYVAYWLVQLLIGLVQ